MTPSTPRLVAVWVPDWPLVALAFEAYECRRLGVPWEIAPDPALSPVAIIGGRGVVAAASAPARASAVESPVLCVPPSRRFRPGRIVRCAVSRP